MARAKLRPADTCNSAVVALLSDDELRHRLTGRVGAAHIDLAVAVNRLCREKGIRIDSKHPGNLTEEDVSYLCDLLNKTREGVLRALAHVILAMKEPGRAKHGK